MKTNSGFRAHATFALCTFTALALVAAHGSGRPRNRDAGAGETHGGPADGAKTDERTPPVKPGTNEEPATRGSLDAARAGETRSIADQPPAPFRGELIEIAFETATKMPVKPHIVTRSRMQDEIAATCFELDQPKRALHYVENIADWRRGKGYAEYALYCARHGETAQVQRFLDRALAVARDWAKNDDSQDWQIDRIRAAIAATHIVLGETTAADDISSGISDSELGAVESEKARRMSASDFDTEFDVLTSVLGTGNFDQKKNALETCVRLFSRFYDDAGRRARLEEKIRTSWEKLPLTIRIETMMGLADAAISNRDREKALALLEEALAMKDSAPWLIEDELEIDARLAALRHRAGDTERAKVEIDGALARFRSERDKIANYRRGHVLRPLAEAYETMGDAPTALSVYKLALEEGALNPNARPRAEDLVATCRSMARRGVAPDAELLARIKEIRDGLKDPW